MHAVPLGWYTISADRIFYFETAPLLLIQTFVGGMLRIYWVESGAPPVGFNNARLLSPVKAARKSLPTGLATTYLGAHASEHATESMRKAVFRTPCDIPGEMAQKKEICQVLFAFFSILFIFFFIPVAVTDWFAPVMRQEDSLLRGAVALSSVPRSLTYKPQVQSMAKGGGCSRNQPPRDKILGEKESPCIARTRISNKYTSPPLDSAADIKGEWFFFGVARLTGETHDGCCRCRGGGGYQRHSGPGLMENYPVAQSR